MARILIVGCGCRGQALAHDLIAAGHSVRGTTRDADRLPAIDAAGAEAVQADPDRLGTLLAQLPGVTVVCWLMGSARGDARPLHRERLESLLAKLVDSGVRGLVYENAGSVEDALLAGGAELVRAAAAASRMPVALLDSDPADHASWLSGARGAVDGVLGAR